uniref:Uncharacterized protein n=1 Tax=Ditylenchus dipsaci TaxID=166011 RepID=A0A915DR30_9BILA
MTEDIQSSSTSNISPPKDHSNLNSAEDGENGNGKGRILFCRKCEGHGNRPCSKDMLLFALTTSANAKRKEYWNCDKLHAKRMVSFTRRNKERIEAARALTAQRKAMAASLVAARSAVDFNEFNEISVGLLQTQYLGN